jgi:hypothetical protein
MMRKIWPGPNPLTNHGALHAGLTVNVSAESDFAAMDAVRSGTSTPLLEPRGERNRPAWSARDSQMSLTSRTDDASEPGVCVLSTHATLSFEVSPAPGGSRSCSLEGRAAGNIAPPSTRCRTDTAPGGTSGSRVRTVTSPGSSAGPSRISPDCCSPTRGSR